jgi:hypothetical protein
MTTTVTIHADVITGVLSVEGVDDWPDADVRWKIVLDPNTGAAATRIKVGPWGVDEHDMSRADRGLVDLGYARVGPWREDSDGWRAQVTHPGWGRTRPAR